MVSFQDGLIIDENWDGYDVTILGCKLIPSTIPGYEFHDEIT